MPICCSNLLLLLLLKQPTNTTITANTKMPFPPTTVRMNPILSFELLFFAVFGQTTTDQTQIDKMTPNTQRTQPYWTEYLFKIVFGIYMLVSVVVLINLLIAMMSDTYQRIQVPNWSFPREKNQKKNNTKIQQNCQTFSPITLTRLSITTLY